MISCVSVSSAIDALWGRIMMDPWLNTRSIGALDAGTDSTLAAILTRFGSLSRALSDCQNIKGSTRPSTMASCIQLRYTSIWVPTFLAWFVAGSELSLPAYLPRKSRFGAGSSGTIDSISTVSASSGRVSVAVGRTGYSRSVVVRKISKISQEIHWISCSGTNETERKMNKSW